MMSYKKNNDEYHSLIPADNHIHRYQPSAPPLSEYATYVHPLHVKMDTIESSGDAIRYIDPIYIAEGDHIDMIEPNGPVPPELVSDAIHRDLDFAHISGQKIVREERHGAIQSEAAGRIISGNINRQLEMGSARPLNFDPPAAALKIDLTERKKESNKCEGVENKGGYDVSDYKSEYDYNGAGYNIAEYKSIYE